MLQSIVDGAFCIALFVNAILFLPQIIRLYRLKNAQELSFTTFFGFNIIQLASVLHGYFHQDNILMLGNVLSLITCSSVALMIVFYRLKNKTNENC